MSGPGESEIASGAADLALDMHPDLTIRVERVGAECFPLLIVDNFVDRPHELVDYAASN
jgi:hypothetical protein